MQPPATTTCARGTVVDVATISQACSCPADDPRGIRGGADPVGLSRSRPAASPRLASARSRPTVSPRSPRTVPLAPRGGAAIPSDYPVRGRPLGNARAFGNARSVALGISTSRSAASPRSAPRRPWAQRHPASSSSQSSAAVDLRPPHLDGFPGFGFPARTADERDEAADDLQERAAGPAGFLPPEPARRLGRVEHLHRRVPVEDVRRDLRGRGRSGRRRRGATVAVARPRLYRRRAPRRRRDPSSD